MNIEEFQVLLAAGLILLMVVAPVYAWPETRKLALPVLGFYVFFLWLNSEFVLGIMGTGHDVVWNWHSWSVIIQQWIHSNVSMGWNPYWGAGQPFALYNNIFCYLPTVAFSHFFNLLGLNLPPTTFFNIIFLFGYFNICTGSLLLFRLLYRNSVVCLSGFCALLFGGLFYAEAHQNGMNVLSFLPYLLFLLVYFYQTKKPGALVFFLFLLGLSVNFYLPSYVYLTLLTFLFLVLLAGLVQPELLRKHSAAGWKAIVSKPGLVVVGLLLFFAAAGPFIANYVELQDYVSPTRGFATAANSTQLSYQEELNTPLHRYSYLFDYETAKIYAPKESFLVKTHGGFYIGVLSSLGILVALLLRRNWFMIIFTGALALLAAGHLTPVWGWVLEYVPLADITRHTFTFARILTLVMIALSLNGFSALISDRHSFARKITASLLAVVILFIVTPGKLSGLQMGNLAAGGIVLVVVSVNWTTIYPRAMMICLPALLAVQCTDLVLFSAHQFYYWGRDIKMTKISYPETWKSLPEDLEGMPFDHTPMFNKQAIWSNRIPNYMFMIQKDFARFLLHNNLLVKRDPESLGTRTIPPDLALREIKGDIIHILPYRKDADPDTIAFQALKRIVGINKPVLTVEGGSPGAKYLQNVLDRDITSSWKAESGHIKNSPWIAFSIQEGFAPDRLDIWYEPSFRTRVTDPIELWLSDNGQTWEFAQNLKRQPAPAGEPKHPAQYILERVISKKYFKLVFKGEHPESVAEVGLVETKSAILPESSINTGVVHQKKSYSSNRVELAVVADREAYILRLENYHSGWRALLDEEEVPILKVYPNFQMIRVPAGEHKLLFEFHSSYNALVYLQIITGFLGGAAFLFWLGDLNLTKMRTRIVSRIRRKQRSH